MSQAHGSPQNPVYMDDVPCRSWRSVDGSGLFPPGQKPFGQLPPGVKPVTSPDDKEKMHWWGEVITVPTGEGIPKPQVGWPWILENGANMMTYALDTLPRQIRKGYLNMQWFDTEPYFHIPKAPIIPIWECPVNDSICARAADRRANSDRRVEWNMLKIMAQRLRHCQGNTMIKESESPYSKNEGYEVLCGPLEETIREMQAAFELKYGNTQSINPNYNLSRRIYMKQKNRFIEDRYRYRTMEHVGGTYNTDTITENNRWVIDDIDQRPLDFLMNKKFYDKHIGLKPDGGDFPKPKRYDSYAGHDLERAKKVHAENAGKDYVEDIRERDQQLKEKHRQAQTWAKEE